MKIGYFFYFFIKLCFLQWFKIETEFFMAEVWLAEHVQYKLTRQ